MKQKEVTISGKTYPVVFNMKTITGFEEIVNHSFFDDDFTKMASRMAIVLAAIFSADKDADIEAKDMLNAENWEIVKDIIEAYTVVMNIAHEFFKVPESEKQEDKPEEETEKAEDPKN